MRVVTSGVRRAPRSWWRVWVAVLAAAALVLAGVPAVPEAAVAGARARTSARAVDPPGPVYAWGYNGDGELGNGTIGGSNGRPERVDLPGGATATAVSGGGSHSLALAPDGQVYAWGRGDFGQLGDGAGTTTGTPVRVNPPGGEPATAIAAGGTHSLALTPEGQVYAWGNNGDGQLGIGDVGGRRLEPVKVDLPPGVTAIAAGNSYSLAVTKDKAVYAWGYNRFGELGDGTSGIGNNSGTPQRVKLPGGVDVTAVGAGDNHGLALTADGHVYAWGNNVFGQLGTGTTGGWGHPPERVRLPDGVTATAVAGGGRHSLARAADGRVYAWGDNVLGQLGNGTIGGDDATPRPVNLPQGVTATAVTAGHWFSMAETPAGRVYAWGFNSVGQLGNGTVGGDSATPQQAHLPAAAAVDAGSSHSLAVADARPRSLTISKQAQGTFTAGGHGSYTLRAGNAGPYPTNGTRVTVRDHLPAGLTVRSMSGTGWSCTPSTLTCTRHDELAAHRQYPPITVSVQVACTVATTVTNTATATGGGDTRTHTARITTGIAGRPAPPARGMDPAAYTSGTTRYVVYTGTNGRVWQKRVGSAACATEEGGRLLSGPAAVNAGGTRILFGEGTDHALWQKIGNGAWTTLGGRLTAKPGAAATSRNVYRVYARGTDGALWARARTASGWGRWHSAGGRLLNRTGPSAAVNGGHFYVLVTGTNRAMFLTRDGTRRFTSAGGGTTTSPGLVNAPSSRSLVGFARGVNGPGWFHRFLSTTPGWHPMRGMLTSGAGGSATTANWFAYGLGTDVQVWERHGTTGATGASWTRVTP